MLKNITVNNFAIIDNLELDLTTGMTVLTGETGAGKSIIIDALQYSLGARADSSMVRHNCKRADITVSFDITAIPNALVWLQTNELDEEQQCLLRRTINADGGSKQFINGQPCTQTQLRELAELLITIHGQHENQNLGKKTMQQQLLDDFAQSLGLSNQKQHARTFDKFAQHGKLLENVQQAFQKWTVIKTEIEQLQNHDHDHSARIELLRYQVLEFEKLALGENELLQLEQEHKKLASADTLYADCSVTKALVSNDSDFIAALYASNSKLKKHQALDVQIANSVDLLEQALIQLQEAHDELETYLEHINISPERLQHIEDRLNVIYDIARKHKVAPEKLLEKFNQITQELISLQNAGQRLDILMAELKIAEKNYSAAAKLLSESRLAAANTFNQQVTKNLQQLGMPEGKFAVNFIARDQFSTTGAEQIEFLVSANPGQPMKPITKIASGGELSRISLAIEVITAQNTNTPTLIFDEVDVGIGGSTAEIVGRLLRELGDKTQVICITHLPQVAARGHHHLKVIKHTNSTQTQTEIVTLTTAEKIQEIARMLGGIKITQQTLAHAKEMLL